jgi:hypothetical protein
LLLSGVLGPLRSCEVQLLQRPVRIRRMSTIQKTVLLFAIAARALPWQVAADIAGEWQVFRPPPVSPPSSPIEDWLRVLPPAVYLLTHSDIPPLAMIRQDLGYAYFPSLPSITITWISDKPRVLSFLQAQSGHRFEGELPGGCWVHLSLEESEDGSTLLGSARINPKISTRDCRSSLAKGFKKGEPFPYKLIRLR